MDDSSLVGKNDDVLKAWNIIKEKGPELGLFVNIPKCELISASGSDVCFKQFEQEMIRVTDGNMSILGSPNGSQFNCSCWVSDKLNKKKNALAYQEVGKFGRCSILFSSVALLCKLL